MKIWAWIKSLSWVAIAGAIVTAITVVLGGAKATRHRRRADRAERELEALTYDQTKVAIEKAAKLQQKVEVHKEKAAAARQRMEAQLDKLGETNEDIDAIADRFNSRRLRESAGGDS